MALETPIISGTILLSSDGLYERHCCTLFLSLYCSAVSNVLNSFFWAWTEAGATAEAQGAGPIGRVVRGGHREGVLSEYGPSASAKRIARKWWASRPLG